MGKGGFEQLNAPSANLADFAKDSFPAKSAKFAKGEANKPLLPF